MVEFDQLAWRLRIDGRARPAGDVQQVEGVAAQLAWVALEQMFVIQKSVGPNHFPAVLIEQAVRGRTVAGGGQIGDGEFHEHGAAF